MSVKVFPGTPVSPKSSESCWMVTRARVFALIRANRSIDRSRATALPLQQNEAKCRSSFIVAGPATNQHSGLAALSAQLGTLGAAMVMTAGPRKQGSATPAGLPYARTSGACWGWATASAARGESPR